MSGGQKARISLARALYSDADIILLDDPLSAVDPDVAEDLFRNCITGAFKKKCVILTTHQIQFLKNLKNIILLKDNKIEVQGSYSELKQQGIDFDEILEGYNNQAKDDIFDEEEEAQEDPTQEEGLPPIDQKFIKQESEISGDHEHSVLSSQEAMISKPEVLENPKKATGLIEKEHKEKGEVKLKIWWKFINFGLGIFGTLAFLVSGGLTIFFNISISYIAGEWFDNDEDEQQNPKYFRMIILATVGFVICSFLRTAFTYISMIASSKALHNKAIWKILRSPVGFFDSNPIGRILTRFTKDTISLDFLIPF